MTQHQAVQSLRLRWRLRKSAILIHARLPRVVVFDSNCTGMLTSAGHNLGSDSTCTFNASGDISNTNPLLGPLQNNGGLTRTHMPMFGSPAIDAASNAGCPAADQRGVMRPVDGTRDGVATCDIGAVEYDLTQSVSLPLLVR